MHILHILHISHIIRLTWDICKCTSFLVLYASRYRFLISIYMSELCYWTYIQHLSFNMVLNMIWCMRWDSLNTAHHQYLITTTEFHMSDSSFIFSLINIMISSLLNIVITQHCHFSTLSLKLTLNTTLAPLCTSF